MTQNSDPLSPTDAEPPIHFARVLGSAELMCPFCQKLIHINRMHWRDPSFQCSKPGCNRKYQGGILLSEQLLLFPPYNAFRLPCPFALRRHNAVVKPEGAKGFIGRITGVVETTCRHCGHLLKDTPEWDTGLMTCGVCDADLFVSLLVAPVAPGRHRRTPVDWVPPPRLEGRHAVTPEELADIGL